MKPTAGITTKITMKIAAVACLLAAPAVAQLAPATNAESLRKFEVKMISADIESNDKDSRKFNDYRANISLRVRNGNRDDVYRNRTPTLSKIASKHFDYPSTEGISFDAQRTWESIGLAGDLGELSLPELDGTRSELYKLEADPESTPVSLSSLPTGESAIGEARFRKISGQDEHDRKWPITIVIKFEVRRSQ